MNWYKNIISEKEHPLGYLDIGHDWYHEQDSTNKDNPLAGYNPKDAVWEYRFGRVYVVTAEEWLAENGTGNTFTHHHIFGEGGTPTYKGRFDSNKNIVSLYETRTINRKPPTSLLRTLERIFPGAYWKTNFDNSYTAKSWYKNIKVASITFDIEDTHKISQPKNILDLSHDLSQFIYYKAKLANEDFAPTINDISPDTSHHDFGSFTGVINFYANPRKEFGGTMYDKNDDSTPEYAAYSSALKVRYDSKITEDAEAGDPVAQRKLQEAEATIDKYTKTYENKPEDVLNAIKTWIADKSQEGYVINVNDTPDVSGMGGGPVFRINVVDNPSQNYSDIPSLNMSNENAMAILELLQLPKEYVGSVPAQELKLRIEQTTQQEMEEGVVDPTIEDNKDGLTIMDQGRNLDYIDSRLQQLYSLADFAISNGFTHIKWV